MNLMLTWSANWVINNSTGGWTSTIADTKLYALIVTLSTQDNTKQLQ